jgi:hypothetical protein
VVAPKRQPAQALKEARDTKFRFWFENRRWRIADEVTGERTVHLDPGTYLGTRHPDGLDLVVTYDHGHFKIPAPGKFHTPLGHAGRSGIIVAEIDTMGQDTGIMAAFGPTALRQAHEKYGLIVGLPGE